MKKLRREFPILSQNTYLNTASSGILYDRLLEYRNEHDLDFLIGGSLFREKRNTLLNDVRKTIATFFAGKANQTVLVQNFSLGLNRILDGLQKKQKILLLKDDYPSIDFAVNQREFEVCYAPIDENLEKNIDKSIEKHQPDIFIFSIVQYISGIKIDLDFIKDIKNKYPDLLIIADGTQFCGTTAFDFKNSGIDILGCSGYKWLLGGYGNGFMLFKDDILDFITPNGYKEAAKQSDYDSSYTNLTARFECGHLDTFNFGSLQFSLNYLSQIKIKTIQEQIVEVSRYAKEELNKLGFLNPSITKRKIHSSIFNLKATDSIFQELSESNIICSQRGDGIRISIHFYNTIEDIDTLLTKLHRYR